MSCGICKQKATHTCSHCSQFLVCGEIIHTGEWKQHQLFHLLGEEVDLEILHLKILQAKSMKKFYYLDENRFIDRFEIPQGDDVVVKFDDNLVASRKALYPLWKDYEREKNLIYAKRIFFSHTTKAGDCLGKWMPIKRLGSGTHGDVFQVCDATGCDYAAKITYKLTPLEIELYRKASDTNIAPFFYESFSCGKIQVIVAEMYEGNVYELLKTRPPNLDDIFTQVFTLMYRLYVELDVVHNDTKVCNYVYREGGRDIRLADYGVSFYKTPVWSLRKTMQDQADLFVTTLIFPVQWKCHESDYDFFDMKVRYDEPNAVRDSLIRVVKAHPEWKISSLAHIWHGGSDPTFD